MLRYLFALSIALILIGQPVLAQHCDDRPIPDDAWIPTQITGEGTRGYTPRRVLVMRAGWQSGPEAMLIEDPGEVAIMFDLLAGNERVGHACGYHWGLIFENDLRQIQEHLHNKECESYRHFDEEIQARLQNYFRRIETAPTHYLLHVELDPAADPEAVAQLLERDGRHAFFLADRNGRFPRLRIMQSVTGPLPKVGSESAEEAIKVKARKKIDAVINLLVSRENARVFIEPTQYMMRFGREELEYVMQATVVFPLAFDESRLKQYESTLSLAGADETLQEISNAEPAFERPTSYILTIVAPEPYSKKLADAICAASPSVRGVSARESVRLNE